MANAMSVMIAARKETREAISVMVRCCENERSNAAKEIAHAISRNIQKKKMHHVVRTEKDGFELNNQRTDGMDGETEGPR